jgi:hypothetical protein
MSLSNLNSYSLFLLFSPQTHPHIHEICKDIVILERSNLSKNITMEGDAPEIIHALQIER